MQRLRDELGAYTTLVVGSRRLRPLRRSGRRTPAIHETPIADAEAERLFALGTRTLADLIAPSGCEVRADHLRLDGQYARVLVVTAYPRLVSPAG